MEPHIVANTTATSIGARCLDGSLPSYSIRRNASSSAYVLFLEGGGWCNGPTSEATVAACAGRGGFAPPSSPAPSSWNWSTRRRTP